MNIPPNMTEQEVLDAIEEAVSRIARHYRFGYHEAADIKQEGRVLAIEVLAGGKYDGVRRLANFLYVHIRNQLSNHKRKHFRRNDAPCAVCHKAFREDVDSKCPNVTSRYCPKFLKWKKCNDSKQNVMNMLDIAALGKDSDYLLNYVDEPLTAMEIKEILEVLDIELSVDDRKTLLLIRAGEQVSKLKRRKLERSLSHICKRHDLPWQINTSADD